MDEGAIFRDVEENEDHTFTEISGTDTHYPADSVIISITQGPQNAIVSTTTDLSANSRGAAGHQRKRADHPPGNFCLRRCGQRHPDGGGGRGLQQEGGPIHARVHSEHLAAQSRKGILSPHRGHLCPSGAKSSGNGLTFPGSPATIGAGKIAYRHKGV